MGKSMSGFYLQRDVDHESPTGIVFGKLELHREER
jgi:hypothetical protein